MFLPYFLSCIYILLHWWMLKLNMTEVSNKEVSACQSNPCEPKAQASDCSKHTVSDSKSPFRLYLVWIIWIMG